MIAMSGIAGDYGSRYAARRGLDESARGSQSFGLQDSMDPEAVQTGLVDDDNREVPARPRRSLAPELGEPTQQPRHVTRLNRVLGHLFPAARRQGRNHPGPA